MINDPFSVPWSVLKAELGTDLRRHPASWPAPVQAAEEEDSKDNWSLIIGHPSAVNQRRMDLHAAANQGQRDLSTCCILALCCAAMKEGGSHSCSRSTLMNSSMVSWLVGVSSNSVNLKGQREDAGIYWDLQQSTGMYYNLLLSTGIYYITCRSVGSVACCLWSTVF